MMAATVTLATDVAMADGIETDALRFGIYYGISQGGDEKWDLGNAVSELGYAPEDDGSLPEWRAKYDR